MTAEPATAAEPAMTAGPATTEEPAPVAVVAGWAAAARSAFAPAAAAAAATAAAAADADADADSDAEAKAEAGRRLSGSDRRAVSGGRCRFVVLIVAPYQGATVTASGSGPAVGAGSAADGLPATDRQRCADQRRQVRSAPACPVSADRSGQRPQVRPALTGPDQRRPALNGARRTPAAAPGSSARWPRPRRPASGPS